MMAARVWVCILAVALGLSVMVPAAALAVNLNVNASILGKQMPDTLFGLFFEEINHAGSGGLWAELVQNRGFEAGGTNTPSIIDPWIKIGTNLQVQIGTELSSPFDRNKVALKVSVLCDVLDVLNLCPTGGVGTANPGFWGMNIVANSTYKVEFWVKTLLPFSLSVAFTSANGNVVAQAQVSLSVPLTWTKQSLNLTATTTNHNASLSITSSTKGVFWLDQVSAMPTDTYKGHGFRKELATMIADLKPGFLRFPGGCYVEGQRMPNAFRWRDSVGPYENRPGHYGDVWNYWTDDGMGYFEGLQLAEDLGATPVWVFNNGISHDQSVPTSEIGPFVQNVLDAIEFARGPTSSVWGAMRALMNHSQPFALKYVGVGNEDCFKPYYTGNYMAFYNAIKAKYPDIKVVSNCDASSAPLDHPADLFDYHIYTNAKDMFAKRHHFDSTSRTGPKAFVSEYAVTGSDAGSGSLLAALAEAAFLIGIELNSDVVEMASYAPLFANINDKKWNPDAIVFTSSQQYGTPSYWMQQFFKKSNGAHLLNATLIADASINSSLVASAIHTVDALTGLESLIIKILNFANIALNVNLNVSGLSASNILATNSTISVLASANLMDENSLTNATKVTPKVTQATNAAPNMELHLLPNSLLALELALNLTLPKSESTPEIVKVTATQSTAFTT